MIGLALAERVSVRLRQRLRRIAPEPSIEIDALAERLGRIGLAVADELHTTTLGVFRQYERVGRLYSYGYGAKRRGVAIYVPCRSLLCHRLVPFRRPQYQGGNVV